jgi:hypothetical protein
MFTGVDSVFWKPSKPFQVMSWMERRVPLVVTLVKMGLCYEPMGLSWTEQELLDSEDGGVLLEGWETGHVTPRHVDQ